MPPSHKTIRVVVSGRVQGVWFRAWTEKTARGLGLTGWVRNRSDGNVEAVIAGPTQDVDRMLQALWQGPPAAQVRDVVELPAAGGTFTDFTVRPTD